MSDELLSKIASRAAELAEMSKAELRQIALNLHGHDIDWRADTRKSDYLRVVLSKEFESETPAPAGR